jgi:hypothetical protein
MACLEEKVAATTTITSREQAALSYPGFQNLRTTQCQQMQARRAESIKACDLSYHKGVDSLVCFEADVDSCGAARDNGAEVQAGIVSIVDRRSVSRKIRFSATLVMSALIK